MRPHLFHVPKISRHRRYLFMWIPTGWKITDRTRELKCYESCRRGLTHGWRYQGNTTHVLMCFNLYYLHFPLNCELRTKWWRFRAPALPTNVELTNNQQTVYSVLHPPDSLLANNSFISEFICRQTKPSWSVIKLSGPSQKYRQVNIYCNADIPWAAVNLSTHPRQMCSWCLYCSVRRN